MKAALILLLACVAVNAQISLPARHAVASVNPCDHKGFLVLQAFEGPGYDHCETWTQQTTGGGATITPQNGFLIQGTGTLKCIGVAGVTAAYNESPVFAQQDEVYFFFTANIASIPAATTRQIAGFELGANNAFATVRFRSDGVVTLFNGSETAATTAHWATNTTYFFWSHYKRNTGGNNGVIDIAFSTTGTRPTSGSNFAQTTGCTVTTKVDRVAVGCFAVATETYYHDTIMVSTTVIGSNPYPP